MKPRALALALVLLAGTVRAQELQEDYRGSGSTPRPDPTILTTEQLLREVASVKELLMAVINGDKALWLEKFESIGKQFVERDKAVEAALQAQREAVGKAEQGFVTKFVSVEQRIDELRDSVQRIEGRTQGIGDSWGFFVGAIGVAVAVITLLYRSGTIKSGAT